MYSIVFIIKDDTSRELGYQDLNLSTMSSRLICEANYCFTKIIIIEYSLY